MGTISKLLIIIFLGVIGIVSAVKITVLAYQNWPLDVSGKLTITSGQTAISVVETLAEQFDVPAPKIFIQLLKWQGLDRKISAGTITLDGVKNISGLIERLANPIYDDLEITILEGWTIRDITNYGKLKNIPALINISNASGPVAYDYRTSSATFEDYATDFAFLSSKPTRASLEGYLFPDTYRINKDATEDDVVRIMLSNFSKRIDQKILDDIKAQGKTLHEIIVMASVIEREVQTPEDMAMVSDIFWKRLEIGMALQADSTVNYVIGGDNPSLTLAQTKIDSPYNTYKFPDLPLGPIGNPGLNAIKAAVYPTKNTFLFFLTDKEGNVHYASTLEQHNKNKQQFLR